MDEKKLTDVLESIVERDVPAESVNLWPAVRASAAGRQQYPAGTRRPRTLRLQWAALSLVLLFAFAGTAYAAIASLTLTVPKSVSIGEQAPYVRLIAKDLDCTLNADADRMACETVFEGDVLTIDATLDYGMVWGCRADYRGSEVPCRSSFDALDMRTYIMIDDYLGLEGDRWMELVRTTAHRGWTESDSIWVGRGIALVLALGASVVLWRRWDGVQQALSSAVLRAVTVVLAGVVILFVARWNLGLVMMSPPPLWGSSLVIAASAAALLWVMLQPRAGASGFAVVERSGVVLITGVVLYAGLQVIAQVIMVLARIID